jgi:hypothetical protein
VPPPVSEYGELAVVRLRFGCHAGATHEKPMKGVSL